MATLVESLSRDTGQLIKSADWNALVAAVQQLASDTAAQVADLNNRLADATVQIDALEASLAAFRATVEPLLGEYHRLTLQTTCSRYAIGELAEITAQVTDLLGNQAGEVWIDFVAAWGQLKPVAGFESHAGTGGRSIAVKANAQGVARVLLQSEYVGELVDADLLEMEAVLGITLTNPGKKVGEAIMAASTPGDKEARAAYQAVTQAYEQTPAIRNYADSYYLQNAGLVAGQVAPGLTFNWRDYLSTVLAFARRDGDPRTPDQGRGFSSIQVTFRDWLGPWIIVDFLGPDNIAILAEDARDKFIAELADSYAGSLARWKNQAEAMVTDAGLLGALRGYQVVREALTEIIVPQPPDFLDPLVHYMGNAIEFQQSLGIAQFTTVGLKEECAALGAFTDAAVYTAGMISNATEGVRAGLEEIQAGMEGVRQQVEVVAAQAAEGAKAQKGLEEQRQKIAEMEKGLAQVGAQAATAREKADTLGGRLDATLAEGGALQHLQAQVTTVSQQVQVLRDLEPSKVTGDIQNLFARIAVLEGHG